MATTSPTFNQQTLIPDLIKHAPQARAMLDRYGLRGCGGENGPHESLEFFARAHEVPLKRLLDELHHSVTRPPISIGGASLLLETFVAAGFTQLASPYARQTMARVVTLRQACQRTGRDCDAFVTALNEQRDELRLRQLPHILPTINLSENEHCHVT